MNECTNMRKERANEGTKRTNDKNARAEGWPHGQSKKGKGWREDGKRENRKGERRVVERTEEEAQEEEKR